MTQEDKELLLVDLCARLPYGVNIKTEGDNESYTLLSINSNKNIALVGLNFDGVYATSKIKIDEVKPYLRPMFSMTEEEEKEFEDICTDIAKDRIHFVMDGSIDSNYMLEKFDWLNKHHFDYRGLILKGLAIEASEGMYK